MIIGRSWPAFTRAMTLLHGMERHTRRACSWSGGYRRATTIRSTGASTRSTMGNSRIFMTTCSSRMSPGRINEKGTFLTTTEAYYIYQSHALIGGTVNFGPPHAWFEGVGPGAPIKGNAPAVGVVNYTEWKVSKRDFLSVRPIDYLVDIKGERTGFATTLASWTVGVTHRFNEWISTRPEVRYEYAFSKRPWDNGTRRGQLMFAIDAIFRF